MASMYGKSRPGDGSFPPRIPNGGVNLNPKGSFFQNKTLTSFLKVVWDGGGSWCSKNAKLGVF